MRLPAVHGRQIRHQFPGHRQRGTIGIPSLLLAVVQ